MPKYAKFLKGLLSNKARLKEACTVTMNERCSAVLLNKLPSKEKDLGSFTIPCDIGHLYIDNALADLGASISLMPYTMYEKLGLGEPKPTRMSLELADISIQYPWGIAKDVLINLDKFVLLIDFVILDMREDSRILIILGRPFLATARAMIDVFNKKIALRVGSEEVIFNVDQSMKKPHTEDDECYRIDDLDTVIQSAAHELLENDHRNKNLEDSINQPDSENRGSNSERPELKDLPSHLEYTYLKGDESCPVIISSKLTEKEKTSLLREMNPVIQPQRRLNPKVQDVVKDEIVRVLPNPNRTRRSREEKIYLSLWDFCLQEDVVRIMQHSGNFSKMHDDKMLGRCEETNLVLNWEKCHFMVKECIVLGHKVSGKGIKVDKAKIDDAKPRLIRWVLLLQGFNIEIKDKKATENLVADHLSRLENPNIGELAKEEIEDKFPDEHLMILKTKLNDEEPWYADYVNYIVEKLVPPKWIPEKKKRCVAVSEILKILAHCHSGPTGGHHSALVTGRKVYEAVFYWPSIFRDAKDYVIKCDACQKSGNISSRNKMPQNNIQVCEVFDVWGLDFMGPYPDSRGNKYILVAVDYVSKFLKGMFARFGVPKALINDKGTHFCNSQLEKAMLRYGVTHRISIAYHP
ncbi:reverse transcriptase domain-containing protein [Tanacetum coccineum]